MKKSVSMLICFILLVSLGINVHAEEFNDLPESHWAYQDIMTLAGEGTVNGYEDGSFQPSKTVTRAEFVKMIGKWDRAYEGTFSDLSQTHWGYEYIMWSGLEPEGNYIYPDREMLRSDVINLIWKRNGSPENNDAPYAISKQGTNRDATSWGYTIGLVQGDDGFNLRLDKALTRAEAATLIVRSRTIIAENKQYHFKNVVNENLLAQTFHSVFPGITYDKNATITYGELARAVMTLGAGGKPIYYDSSSLDTHDLFEHEYAKDLYVLANKVWGSEYYSQEKIDQNANLQDSLSGLVYGLVRRGGKTVNLGKLDAFYEDCVDAKSTTMENLCLSYAAAGGVKLTAGARLSAEQEATLGDIAALLVQLDEAAGLELGYIGDAMYNVKLNKDLSVYPANYADYASVIEGVPVSVYNLKQEATKPAEYYTKANQCAFVYTAFLGEVKNILKSEQNVNVSFTFYLSLTYEENGKTVFIVKCTATSDTVDLNSAFSKFLKEKTDLKAVPNKDFFVAFETYQPLMDVYLPSTGAFIKSIIIPD